MLFAALFLLGVVFAFWALRQQSEDMPVSAVEETETETECEDEECETENELDFSFAVNYKGAAPDIVDFINAILSQEDIGEALGEMEENWEKYLSGKKLPKGRKFFVDKENGYMRYDAVFPPEENGTRYSGYNEFCVMDCSDTQKKLVVENMVDYRDGKPFEGQFSGLTFYMYDGGTKRMEFEYASNLIDDSYRPEKALVVVHKLSCKEKAIECTCHMDSGETQILHLTWNGKTFDISNN